VSLPPKPSNRQRRQQREDHSLIIIAGLQDSPIAALDAVAARAVDAVARDEPFDAAVPAFLLRHYLATDQAGLADTLGAALARSLDLAAGDTTVIGRAAWLTLLVEAAAIADDERIRPAAERLIAGLQAEWPTQDQVADASASVEACLRAVEPGDPGESIQPAIDQLERVIGGSYRPGDGLMCDVHGTRVRCGFGDHVRAASALLTAFELTGRLPYSMLAEELMLIARREPAAEAGLVIQCEAARVLCRLAALHDDPGYRAAAVIATDADYHADASHILAAQSAPAHTGTTAEAAAYGLALRELLQYVR
jgi:hypothetical protein